VLGVLTAPGYSVGNTVFRRDLKQLCLLVCSRGSELFWRVRSTWSPRFRCDNDGGFRGNGARPGKVECIIHDPVLTSRLITATAIPGDNLLVVLSATCADGGVDQHSTLDDCPHIPEILQGMEDAKTFDTAFVNWWRGVGEDKHVVSEGID